MSVIEESKELDSESAGQMAKSQSAGQQDDSKIYKTLKPEKKISVLLEEDDCTLIEKELDRIRMEE